MHCFTDKRPSFGIVNATFLPNNYYPFPNDNLTETTQTLTLTLVQELKRFGELFGSTFTDQFFDDLLGSVTLPLPKP